MSAAFTPGPWVNGLDDIDCIWAPDAGESNVICSPPDERMVGSFERWPANAHLIAAAPELYASTEETHAWVRRIQDVMTGYLVPDGYDADEALNHLIEMLDGPDQREIQGRAFAALARAKGGSNGRS